MHEYTPFLSQVRLHRLSNIWLFTDQEGRRFLIDTGHGLSRPILWWNLRRAGLDRPGMIQGVILTHRHSDHAGNAAWLRRQLRCPVFCHAHDAGVLCGREHPPRMVVAGKEMRVFDRMLCHVEDAFPAMSHVDDAYEEGKWRFGFRVFTCPGHTDGTAMLYHEATGTLFSGDALLTGYPPFYRREILHLAVPAFSQDAERCHEVTRHALRTLHELPPVRYLCPGHGYMVTEGVLAKLSRL